MDTTNVDAGMERLLKDIKRHAREITRLHGYGAIAIVLDAMDERDAEQKRIARAWGWDGKTACWRMSSKNADALALADSATRKWVKQPRPDTARIFVLGPVGTLLVNFHPDRGYWIEEGSTDAELKASAN